MLCLLFAFRVWSPPDARSNSHQVYKIQPRSIVDYEPGCSSIAFKESKPVSDF